MNREPVAPVGRLSSLVTLVPLALYVVCSLRWLGYVSTQKRLKAWSDSCFLCAPEAMPLGQGLHRVQVVCERYLQIRQCLALSLVAHHYLRHAHKDLELKLGVGASSAGRACGFHAWLEHRGKVVYQDRAEDFKAFDDGTAP